MTAPVEFVTLTSGRIEVMLGAHLIGVIEPWSGPHLHKTMGKIEAYYWITLPVDGGADGRRRPARSTNTARRLILHRLAEWFEAAGPLCAPMAEALALMAAEEREAERATIFPAHLKRSLP